MTSYHCKGCGAQTPTLPCEACGRGGLWSRLKPARRPRFEGQVHGPAYGYRRRTRL